MFDKNINILQKNEMHWIGGIDSSSITHTFITSENSRIEYFEDINGKIFKTEDTYDKSFQNNPLKKEIIFSIGINSVIELEKLYKNINKDSYIVVIEPNLSFFNHVLHKKDLKIFQNKNIVLFSDKLEQLSNFTREFISKHSLIGLAKNINFYQTDYYRKYEYETTKRIIQIIREIVRNVILSVGNSIEDGLGGLKNNLENLEWILKSKDISRLKNVYKDKPAIIVSAGPSLNKNINELKRVKNRAIIIAVDTIVNKLLLEGIVPDFVCSIEREKEIYEYFYKDKSIPKEVTLVGPPVLDPRIFREFNGEIMLPMRAGVAEYKWIHRVLGLGEGTNVEMGASCAHVAFGLAMHLGASPIILVGQDLAYGSTEGVTHASGTIYDKKVKDEKEPSLIQDYKVQGYNDDEVRSTYIWIYFKEWFEAKINQYDLFVINATEGGAKINSTIQKSLKETIDVYCSQNIESVQVIINSIKNYDINKQDLRNELKNELSYLAFLKEKCINQLENIKSLKITYSSSNKKLIKIVEELQRTDLIMTEILNHDLLRHNLQSIVLKAMWDTNNIEPVLNVKNLLVNKEIHERFLTPVIVCISQIEECLNEAIESYFSS